MAELVRHLKVVAELGSGVVPEAEVPRMEQEDFAVPKTLGLTLDESKKPMAASQVEIVFAQVASVGEGSDGARTAGQCS